VNRVNAPDGTPLVYDAYEATHPGVAVLFLHDWDPEPAKPGEPSAATGMQLRDAGYAAYFLDQRGHGRSGGRRGHLSRFSQLVGHGFGGLVVLRYLETQPGEPPAAAVISSPWLAWRRRPAAWKRIAARLADLWPMLPTGTGSRYMTAGARAELQWAQHAVLADAQRIERPLLLLLAGEDRVIDAAVARRFADDLAPRAQLNWYAELPHELLAVPRVMADVTHFIATYRRSDRDPSRG